MDGNEPKRRGRPRVTTKRTEFRWRIPEALKQVLVEAARAAGRTVGEELEARVRRDIAWQAAKEDIDRMRAEARAQVDAARVSALRLAGLVVLRESGNATRVIIDLATMLAESDGLLRGLRPGFLAGDAAPEPPRRMTAEEERRALQEIEKLRAEIAALKARGKDDEVA